jgi:S-DNA-T family DNA segregation ATPase FtsK/SpoIIIE
MTTRVVHRPARTVRPLPAEQPLTISPPPVLPEVKAATGLHSLVPLAGSAAGMSMMMFLRGPGFATLGAVIMVVALCGAGAFHVTQRGQATRKRKAQRECYLDYLEDLREQLRRDEQEYRQRCGHPDPAVNQLLDVVRDPARLWERRRADVDFLCIRIGTGALPLRDIQMPDQGTLVNPTDPFMKSEATAVIRRFSRTPGLPLRVELDRAGDVSVIGAKRADVLGVARAILAQVAALHAPDDVTVAVLADPEREQDWSWTRWLPHMLDRERLGPAGPIPRLVTDLRTLGALLAEDLAKRASSAAKSYRHGAGAQEARTRCRLLVIDDAHGQVARQLATPDTAVGLPGLGVTVVHLLADRLHEPGEVSRRITVEASAVTVQDLAAAAAVGHAAAVPVHGTLDDACVPLVDGLARQIAPLRLSPDSYDDGSGTPPADFTALLGITDPARLDLDRLWRPRTERHFLRVPLGVSWGVEGAGRSTLLDLKESAQLGMGPHGLCVGATGSGKSELLRTLVLALVTCHPPEQLSLVLVDYKGGATFAPFERLPHVAGLITNLASDASMVERMYTSLEGEVLRRQQLLADAGKLTDIGEYTLHRARRANLPPLRYLFVIIDEFGELLSAKPEFVELFLRIGRIGRSIGVHLLLSSQRVEQGKVRGLKNYLSYRIGLRTLSEAESRTVLDTPDAFCLPSLPGNGYLKVDVTVYEKFKAAYVSGPLRDGSEPELAPVIGPLVKPMPRFGRPPGVTRRDQDRATPTARTTGPTLLSTMVRQIADTGGKVPPIWLPPLPAALTLDRAAGGFDVTPHGLRLRLAQQSQPGLQIPIGLLDDPARQWQGPWLVDLTVSGGNLLVLGGPGTGKTTALRTLALGLATTQTPTDLGIYAIDLLGSGLRGLSGLPHVGGVASREDRERIRRTIDEVYGMLMQRELLFARHGLDTVAELRTARSAGRLVELSCSEVVLLLDGYGQLFAESDGLESSLESKVHDIIARGGRHGVHVVATARRWNEVRAAQQVAFANRIELRMAEPGESSIDGKLARAVPVDVPGRALSPGKLFGQIALPRLDAVPDPATSALPEAATMVRSAWTGPLPAPVRVLPAVLPVTDLLDVTAAPGTVPFGRFESDFSPAALDLFGPDQHLLALGDSGTGKTNLLRLVAETLVRQHSFDELVFAVFDPRHGLADAVPEPYRGGYAPNQAAAQQLATAVGKELAGRDLSKGATPAPRIVLLIDDYDILAASATQPLGALVPYLAAGRDLGLHVVLTRRVAGASRGLYEPFTLGVREAGCLALLMSGDRSEGQLFAGVRPTILPVGRAQYIRPGEAVRTVQTAYLEERS